MRSESVLVLREVLALESACGLGPQNMTKPCTECCGCEPATGFCVHKRSIGCCKVVMEPHALHFASDSSDARDKIDAAISLQPLQSYELKSQLTAASVGSRR